MRCGFSSWTATNFGADHGGAAGRTKDSPSTSCVVDGCGSVAMVEVGAVPMGHPRAICQSGGIHCARWAWRPATIPAADYAVGATLLFASRLHCRCACRTLYRRSRQTDNAGDCARSSIPLAHLIEQRKAGLSLPCARRWSWSREDLRALPSADRRFARTQDANCSFNTLSSRLNSGSKSKVIAMSRFSCMSTATTSRASVKSATALTGRLSVSSASILTCAW